MLDFNEKTATEGVLKSFSSIKNERLKELMQKFQNFFWILVSIF